MLDLAQESIRVFEDMVLLKGQTADPFQGLHSQERIALTHLGQVASIKELEELNGKLNVADAAVPRFDLCLADSGSQGLMFNAPLDDFDFIDFRKTQIL